MKKSLSQYFHAHVVHILYLYIIVVRVVTLSSSFPSYYYYDQQKQQKQRKHQNKIQNNNNNNQYFVTLASSSSTTNNNIPIRKPTTSTTINSVLQSSTKQTMTLDNNYNDIDDNNGTIKNRSRRNHPIKTNVITTSSNSDKNKNKNEEENIQNNNSNTSSSSNSNNNNTSEKVNGISFRFPFKLPMKRTFKKLNGKTKEKNNEKEEDCDNNDNKKKDNIGKSSKSSSNQEIVETDELRKSDGNNQTTDNDGNAGNNTEVDVDIAKNETDSSSAQSMQHKAEQPPVMPMSPMSSLIFLPPPAHRSGRSGNISPGSLPPVSPTEATVTNLISSILPLVVRLLLLTFLSSSSLFGHGDTHIYSPEPTQHFVFERVNDRFQKDSIAMKKALEHHPQTRKHGWKFVLNRRRNEMKKALAMEKGKDSSMSIVGSETGGDKEKRLNPLDKLYSRTVIVVNVETMDNDMDVTVEYLRDSISCILRQYNGDTRIDMGNELEVIFCIESPGGVVQDFGLAADQITRLKDAGSERGDLIVTVCVDKIAASGGYMMACQASPGQLIAAPFAILGSIGVLRETINVHDVLEKYGIRPLMMKAGNAKAPLTSTTKVTDESLAFVQNNLDRVHDAFRDLVSKSRSEALNQESYEKVTNGDIFLGKHALEYGLVDRIMSSDEYINERIEAGDRVLKMHKYDKSRMGMRFSPLDLLFLKSNGILGKRATRMIVQSLAKVSPILVQCSTTFGIVKALETCFYRRKHHEDSFRNI